MPRAKLTQGQRDRSRGAIDVARARYASVGVDRVTGLATGVYGVLSPGDNMAIALDPETGLIVFDASIMPEL